MIHNFKFFSTSVFVIILIVLLGCNTAIPGAEVRDADNVLLREIISRKWKGTVEIPAVGMFADEGVQRVNCFGFASANSSGVASYEWKSDIYSNAGPPKEVYFHHENTSAGMDFTPIFEDMFFFVLRYNTTNDSLGYQYKQRNEGKPYSVQQPLLSIDDVTGTTNFNNLSIYMPVYVRNIKIAANAGDVSTLQMNFGIQFAAAKTADPQTAINNIASDLHEKNKNNVRGILQSYWVDYATVDDIENGNNNCPNF